MLPQKQAEEAIVSSFNETDQQEGVVGREEEQEDHSFSVKNFLWHGGSVWDAWFSCASNQVAQVLLTLPYSFSQLGMLSGILLQVFYGILGSWTAYLISVLYVEYRSRKEKENVNFKNHVIQWFEVLDGLLGPYWKALGLAFNCTFLLFGSVIQLIACASNIYYINDNLDKRTWTYIFGACCATTVFIPSFHNYRIWSFLGLGMTTYTAWYLTIASIVHGQAENVTHTGPKKLVLYFTGATNILYTFGGHAVTVEIMHAMWKPQKFKYIYLMATLYVFTLTIPSATAVYWAFGDQLLNHSNAFSLLPKNGWRDGAVILMLIHQFITFGFACTPLYFVWEKVIGMHDTRSICLRALARLPVVIPIWFLAIIFPFFGPINSAVGALLVSFTVYIIPSLAHMLTYRKATARKSGGSKNHDSEEECYQSFTKEGYYVPGSDPVPKFDMQYDDYKEPEPVPPCLRVTNNSWEILVSSAHLRPTYAVRIPIHIGVEILKADQKQITLTLVDSDEDGIEDINCDVFFEDGDKMKRYIGQGWNDFVKKCNVEVDDRLLFQIYNNNPFNCYVKFLERDV